MVLSSSKPPDGPRTSIMEEAGQKLKRVREKLRLRFRDVEEASARIAARHNNDEFVVALSRLADIENKGTMPSVYRLYSLCAIYRIELSEVLSWYGISLPGLAGDADVLQHPPPQPDPDSFQCCSHLANTASPALVPSAA